MPEYRDKTAEELAHHHIPDPDRIVFLEVTITDPSEFEAELRVTGARREGYRILRVASPAVPNAIAALLLHLRDSTGTPPHIYFDWTEGNPVLHLLRYLFFGVGEVAPITREILRRAEPDPTTDPSSTSPNSSDGLPPCTRPPEELLSPRAVHLHQPRCRVG
jgi:hypothetical protein